MALTTLPLAHAPPSIPVDAQEPTSGLGCTPGATAPPDVLPAPQRALTMASPLSTLAGIGHHLRTCHEIY